MTVLKTGGSAVAVSSVASISWTRLLTCPLLRSALTRWSMSLLCRSSWCRRCSSAVVDVAVIMQRQVVSRSGSASDSVYRRVADIPVRSRDGCAQCKLCSFQVGMAAMKEFFGLFQAIFRAPPGCCLELSASFRSSRW